MFNKSDLAGKMSLFKMLWRRPMLSLMVSFTNFSLPHTLSVELPCLHVFTALSRCFLKIPPTFPGCHKKIMKAPLNHMGLFCLREYYPPCSDSSHICFKFYQRIEFRLHGSSIFSCMLPVPLALPVWCTWLLCWYLQIYLSIILSLASIIHIMHPCDVGVCANRIGWLVYNRLAMPVGVCLRSIRTRESKDDGVVGDLCPCSLRFHTVSS